MKKLFLTLLFLLFISVKYVYAGPVGAVIWAIGVFIVDTIWAHPIITALTIASIAYSLATSTNQDRLKAPSSKYTAPIIDNTWSNEGVVPIIYGGPIVVGGNILWQSDPGTTVQRFLALCIGEISAITNVLLDDIDINTLSGCSYTAYYGTATQTVDSRAGTAVKGLRHVAYLAATITTGDKVSSNPILSARVTGRKIQTWNSTNSNWTTNALSSSKNPAAIIRDYLLLSTVLGGCGVPAAYVDDTSFGAVSVICDALIDNGSGGTEPRYELDIVIDTRHSAIDNLDKMLITCNAALIRSGATYKLAIEKSGETAVQAFTEDNINKGTFSYGYGKADETPNKVGVEWISALEPKNPKRIAWAEDELDQETRGVREEKIETYGIIRQTQASRQAKKILYERKINDIWCEFESNMSAMHCEPFDVVSVTHSRPSWTAALFRIIEMNEVDFGKAKYLCQAYNGSVVDDKQGSTLDDWDYGSPPNPYEPVPDVADLAISEVGWVNADGTYTTHINVTWTAPSSRRELLDSYIIELKKGSADYIVVGEAPASATSYRISTNLESGIVYQVRVKTRSINRIISNGSTSSALTLVGKNLAPANVSGFIYSWGKELEIMWNIVTNIDLAGYEVRDENANFGTDNVHLIYRGTANRKILIPTTRAPGIYYLKAYNTGGVYSVTATAITPTNAVPSTPTVTVDNWFGFAILKWTDDSAVDIEYYEVYKSETNTWTGEETLYSRVAGKSAQVQGKAPVDATASAANATSITDATLIGLGVNYFVGDVILQTSGTYVNQEAVITAFNNATGLVTVASWPSGTPSVGDKFVLKDRVHFKVRGVDRYGAGIFSSSNSIDFVQLTEAQIGDKVISARKLIAGEVITLSAQIKDAVITSAKILNLDAGKIIANTITADKYNQLRNTYTYDSEDSLDATYSFEIPFKIVSEMIAIQSVELSFKIKNFRSYSTGAASGGGSTSGAGGGQTSSAVGTPSGGGSTSGAVSDKHQHTFSLASGTTGGSIYALGDGSSRVGVAGGAVTGTWTSSTVNAHTHTLGIIVGGSAVLYNNGGTLESSGAGYDIKTSVASDGHFHYLRINSGTAGNFLYDGNSASPQCSGGGTLTTTYEMTSDHTHTTPNHTHPDHTHSVVDHTHTTPAHTHALTFGIYEEANAPTINYYIDNGAGYGAASANYTTDQLDLNITASISGTGWKRIKFTTSARCIIAAIIECKVDILA